MRDKCPRFHPHNHHGRHRHVTDLSNRYRLPRDRPVPETGKRSPSFHGDHGYRQRPQSAGRPLVATDSKHESKHTGSLNVKPRRISEKDGVRVQSSEVRPAASRESMERPAPTGGFEAQQRRQFYRKIAPKRARSGTRDTISMDSDKSVVYSDQVRGTPQVDTMRFLSERRDCENRAREPAQNSRARISMLNYKSPTCQESKVYKRLAVQTDRLDGDLRTESRYEPGQRRQDSRHQIVKRTHDEINGLVFRALQTNENVAWSKSSSNERSKRKILQVIKRIEIGTPSKNTNKRRRLNG